MDLRRTLLTSPGWLGYYVKKIALQNQLKNVVFLGRHVSDIYFSPLSVFFHFPFHLSTFPLFSFAFSLLPHFDFSVLLLLPSRQNPVPEESCARRGHEAPAFHRRLLQGKEASLSTSFSSPSDSEESHVPQPVRGQRSRPIIVLSHAPNMGHET